MRLATIALAALLCACSDRPSIRDAGFAPDAAAIAVEDTGTVFEPDARAVDATPADASAPDADAGIEDAGPCLTSAYPALGAAIDPRSGAFTVSTISRHATRIEVDLYAASFGEDERLAVALSRAPGTEVWSAEISALELERAGLGGTEFIYYGFRAWGPNWTYDPAWTKNSTLAFTADVDGAGHRFNPNKLLIDPYALELSHDPLNARHREFSIYRTGSADRARDNGRVAPKSIAFRRSPIACAEKPAGAFKDQIIYEVHLRGFTKNDPSIPAELRGTFAGAALKADYLRDLGVTAVEFLPIFETQNDTNDLEPGSEGDNYWGYSTLAFFAPDRRYAADQSPGGPTRELIAMVSAFHQRGIEVYFDVVYNHTPETGASDNGNAAALFSLRGLDNAAFYELDADPRAYVNRNGVGANVNVADPMVRRLVLDAIRYHRDILGADGFRFDLASVLGNRCTSVCFEYDRDDPDNILNRAAAENVRLIAEPWGIGPGTYQVGNFPAAWSEWNDIFRDTIRRDQNQLGRTAVTPRDLVTRIFGSPDLFHDDGRMPWASINYVASHDGYTLRDVYSYHDDQSYSWDQGGDAAAQRRATRTGLAMVMLSAGVPMITGGDELYRTQNGNHNPFDLDSAENWIDWAGAAERAELVTFARRLIAFRNAHPALRPATWHRGQDHDGDRLPDRAFYDVDARALSDAYLDDPYHHFLGWRIDGDELGDSVRSIYVAYNGWQDPLRVSLPELSSGSEWLRVADTSPWMEPESNFHAAGAEYRMNGRIYDLGARALAIFIER